MKPRRGHLPGDVRVVIGRGAKLPRTLSARALFAACYGNVGSSIYYSLGVVAAVALGLTPLALILAGGIFVTTALNYAEGTAAMPHAGGSSAFARRAFNEPIGFLVGWIQLLNFAVTVSISAYTAISYLTVFDKYVGLFSAFRDPFAHALAAVVLTGLLMFLNVVGIQESSVINLTLAMLDLVTQLVLVALGVFLLFNWQRVISNIHWGVAPTWGNFLASISLAMVTYTGIETISNLSEEARNPGRAVPRLWPPVRPQSSDRHHLPAPTARPADRGPRAARPEQRSGCPRARGRLGPRRAHGHGRPGSDRQPGPSGRHRRLRRRHTSVSGRPGP